MTSPISPDDLLRSALNALALRQRTLANNVANADTPGFKSSDVRFEQLLSQAMQGQAKAVSPARTHAQHLGGSARGPVEGELVTSQNTPLRNDGNNVDIDQQMVRLAETAITYSALTQLAASRLALLKSVISER